MKHRYSRKHFPPAPVLEVRFITAAEGLGTEPLTAIVDTGADITLVPLSHLNQIAAPVTVERWIRSPWGERQRVLLYLVDVLVNNITLPGVEVVGDERVREVILGRDVLNRLRMLLDGPAGEIEVLL